jgi:hypothetical protein
MESKVKPNLLLVIVKYGLDVVWYLSFVSIVVAVIFMVSKREQTNSPRTLSVEVEYHGNLSESHTSVYDNLNTVAFKPTHGKLEFSGETLPWKSEIKFTVLIALSMLCTSALFLVFLFYLRKIFTSFLHHSPFCMENVKRIRIIACCFVVFNIFILIAKWVLTPQVIALTSFPAYTTYNFPGDYKYIIIAAVIYVLADIFKYGFQIQDENNKFV